jgi:hypothetical protein
MVIQSATENTGVSINATNYIHIYIYTYIYIYIYRVIQDESAILWELIVCVNLSKKVHMIMGPILNGYRDNITTKITYIVIRKVNHHVLLM